MITRLDLEDYGKFSKRALEFGPFTVVLGPNEAGKTTVFDALFDALCAGSRHENHPAWKNLAGRYGALRKAVLTWQGEPFSFNDEEFLELFAIRAGEASVHAVKGKSWKAVAEARLLNSGLNPAGLAAALAAKAKTEKGGSVRAQIAGLKKLVEEHGPALGELRQQRDTIFSGEVETARLDAELREKNAAAEAKKAELRELNSRIEGLAEACRMAAALDGIKALRTLAETEEALGVLKNYGRSELPAYRALVASKQERDRAADSAEAALAERRAAVEAARAAAAQLADRDPELRRQVEKAAELSARLSAFVSAPQKEVFTVLKPMRYGIWGGAAALALFVALSARNLPGYIAALLIAAAGAWVGLKLSVKQTLAGHTPEETRAFLDALAAEWALVSETPLPAAPEEVYSVLAQPAADHAALTEAYNAKAAEIADAEAALAAMAQTAAELKRAAAEAAQTAGNWLKDRGCAAEDDYQAKVTEHEKLSARAADLHERVKVFMNRHNCPTAEALKDRLYTEREALDRKGVDPAKADEPELERLKQRAAALGKAAHALEAEAAAIDARLGNARARAEAKLEGLPGRINQLETEAAVAADKIAELELQLQAYTLAADNINRLAEKSNVAFELLAKEVAATLGEALPGSEARFDSFDAAEAKLKDAGGKLRRIKYLSSGLQDLFMLAARLLMARKARQDAEGKTGPALLVLDEPFYTLDPERERAALKLLGAFQRETGWQIILFTKDEKLAKAALAYALQVKIIELK